MSYRTPCIESHWAPSHKYPFVVRKQKRHYLHRKTWEEHYGPIPPGMFVCHHCDNSRCIRIQHLFLGTAADNNRDMNDKKRGRNSKKMSCKQGHPFDEVNTGRVRRRDGRMERQCRACLAERHHQWWLRKKGVA